MELTQRVHRNENKTESSLYAYTYLFPLYHVEIKRTVSFYVVLCL